MKKAFLIIWFFASSLGFGTTSGINFVYQPLTTMGTDEDPAIIVAKIPVIAVGEPENLFQYISMPLKLQQHSFGTCRRLQPALITQNRSLGRVGFRA